MHLFIGPRNGVNKATPAIQKKTRGDPFEKRNQCDRSTNEVLTCGPDSKINKWSKPQRCALNPNNIFGRPLDMGVTDGIVKVRSHVHLYGSSKCLEPNVQIDRL